MTATKKWMVVLLEAKWVVIPLVLINLSVVGLLCMASLKWPPILSSGLLAYSFGLRHAVDADHLAAIDNVTRRMMADGKRPLTVGLFFSLGHSTIVFFLSFLVAITAGAIQKYNSDSLEMLAGIVGTVISAGFLALIGFINLFCLVRVVKDYRLLQEEKRNNLSLESLSQSRSFEKDSTEPVTTNCPLSSSLEDIALDAVIDGEVLAASIKESAIDKDAENCVEVDLECAEQTVPHPPSKSNEKAISETTAAAPGGLMTRCCPKLFNIIDAPWKMYIVGFLFGLGFDTATEVALLGITAVAPGEGIPAYMVMILPTLFASGMALVDTLDGIFMMWAYGWAFIDPEQKLLYNFVITLTSLLIAFFIGGVEVLGVIQQLLHLSGPFWNVVSELNSEYSGVAVIAIFVLCFFCSVLAFYIRRCRERMRSRSSTSVSIVSQPSPVSVDLSYSS